MEVNKGQMLVSSIKEGTVLDHIPSDKLFKIVSLLQLDKLTTPVTIGNNLESTQFGQKGIIKMSNRFCSESEINKIALLAPDVLLNIIKDFKVVDKVSIVPPKQVVGVVRCSNLKCITNAEPMPTRFLVHQMLDGYSLECCYCGRKVSSEQAELL